MKTIVICYSLTGNTAWTARRLAEALGADLLELKSRKAYPDHGFRKFLRGGKSAMAAECPPLEPYDFHAGQYDRVIFATPLWAPDRAARRAQRKAVRRGHLLQRRKG